MAGRRYGDDSLMHAVDTDSSNLQLYNMMNQYSTDVEHKHILLRDQMFLKPIRNLPVMQFVEKVTFMDTVVKNGSILRFKQWCPNVSELAFIRVQFSRTVYESFASTMIDDDDIMAGVKKLIFHFQNSWDLFGRFPEEMDEKFPSLEEFKLILDTMDYESGFELMDFDVSHHPIYFKNLRKFSLAAFGDINETDRIFENMNICGVKLEELSCFGVLMSQCNLQWINRCRQLREVTIDCGAFGEGEINELKGMQCLARFKLIVEEIECDAMEIISFVQCNLQLNRVSITCGPESKNIEFGDDFKTALDQLTRDRSDLSINITFNKPSEKQSIKITKEGVVQTHVPRHEEDTDDDGSSFNGNETETDDDYVNASDDSNSDDDCEKSKSDSDAVSEE